MAWINLTYNRDNASVAMSGNENYKRENQVPLVKMEFEVAKIWKPQGDLYLLHRGNNGNTLGSCSCMFY